MSLIKDLLATHGAELTGALTSQLGMDKGKARAAIGMITPMVLNGLKSQKDNGGDDAVSGLLSSIGGTENGIGNFSQLLKGGDSGADASHILGSLLGGQSQGSVANQALQKNLGVGSGEMNSLVTAMVPTIMGFLSQKGREDPNTPDTQSGISALLDRDGDGSALDDVASMVMSLAAGQAKGKGGILGSLLGGLLGGKR